MTKSFVLAPWCFIHFHPHSFPSVPCQGGLRLCLVLLRAKHFLIDVLIKLTERLEGWLGLGARLCSQAGLFLSCLLEQEGEAGRGEAAASAGVGMRELRALRRMRQLQKYQLPSSREADFRKF